MDEKINESRDDIAALKNYINLNKKFFNPAIVSVKYNSDLQSFIDKFNQTQPLTAYYIPEDIHKDKKMIYFKNEDLTLSYCSLAHFPDSSDEAALLALLSNAGFLISEDNKFLYELYTSYPLCGY